MKITITHKGITVEVQDEILNIPQTIEAVIKEIDAKCNNCTLDQRDTYEIKHNEL